MFCIRLAQSLHKIGCTSAIQASLIAFGLHNLRYTFYINLLTQLIYTEVTMKDIFKFFVLAFMLLGLLTSCTNENKKYVIGVSQCSDDSWRTKLQQELEFSTYFNDEAKLVFCSANDDVKKQCEQIDSLVDIGVDLLIVSPIQLDPLSATIHRATEKKIPVILFDRKSGVADYTAYMGADNYKIGKMLGEYAATLLNGEGQIVEIGGEHGSSPAIERHNGFNDALKAYPKIRVVGYAEGNWKEKSGEKAMRKILDSLERVNPDFKIDLVYGGNDRMAVGARDAVEHYISLWPDGALAQRMPVYYLGIDALPTPGGGMEMVREGRLTASAIYPTHGDELMALALQIVKGEPFERNNYMETSIVTAENAKVLLMQYKEVENQQNYIARMHARVDSILSQFNLQRLLLFFFILLVGIVSTLLVVSVRAYRTKKRLYEQLRIKNEEVNREKAIVERQRDELEEQRDQLLDATTQAEEALAHAAKGGDKDEVLTPEMRKSEFMKHFEECLEKRYQDPDLSVEDIGRDMCLSRVQLYRRVKAISGKTPVELIREKRLAHAHALLTDESLTVSEVAYRVGFSAPSYFTKCYREFYGIAPSENKK